MNAEDISFLHEAIRLSEEGMRRGDGGPFGAIVVRDGTVIGRGWNRVLKTNDPTAHAEIVAIRAACEHTGNYWLEGCQLYVNCEPCPMCLAAIYWARIRSVTFAANRSDAAAIEFSDAYIYDEISRPPEERSVEMRQGLREEALRVMRIWPSLNAKRPY